MYKYIIALLLFFSANCLAIDKFDGTTSILDIDTVVLNGIQYNNVAIELKAFDVISVGSSLPYPNGVTFIPGTYTHPSGVTCQLSNATLASGREQASLTCLDSSKHPFSATWVNGPIVGNPFQISLENAGIDKLPASQDYAWGEMSVGGVGEFQCFYYNAELISATQTGNTILLNNYYAGNTSKCTVTLTLQ